MKGLIAILLAAMITACGGAPDEKAATKSERLTCINAPPDYFFEDDPAPDVALYVDLVNTMFGSQMVMSIPNYAHTQTGVYACFQLVLDKASDPNTTTVSESDKALILQDCTLAQGMTWVDQGCLPW